MSKLFRILGAASRETEILKATKALESYASASLKLSEATVNSLARVDNILRIGEKAVPDLISDLKAGKVTEAAKTVYKIPYVTDEIKTKLIDEVKDLPAYHVQKSESGARELAYSMRDAPNYEKLSDPKFTGELTEEMVNKSSKVKYIIDYLKDKSFTSFTLKTVAFTAGTIFAIGEINKHRAKLSGCFKYEVLDSTTVACKVTNCSCRDGNILDSAFAVSACAVSSLPEEMKNVTCKDVVGFGCVQCPPTSIKDSDGYGSLSDSTSLSEPSAQDKVYYKCINASIIDAINDIVSGEVNELARNIGDIKEAVGGFLEKVLEFLPYLFYGAGAFLFVVGILYVYFRFFSGGRRGFDDDETEYIELRESVRRR